MPARTAVRLVGLARALRLPVSATASNLLRTTRDAVNRGFIRMFGLGVTALLLAITLAGRNAEHLHNWYTTRNLPEPWRVHLGEPVDDRPLHTEPGDGAQPARPATVAP